MTGVHRVAAGLAVAALAAIGVGVAAGPAGAQGAEASQSESTQRQVAEAIRVQEGNKRIAVMAGDGVQTYQCVGGAWTFVQPDAILERHGRAEVLHSKGPVWTDVSDGSSVIGAVEASSPVDGAIPELRLKATPTRGPGLLSNVTFIQRLRTTGGLAPTGSCVDGVTASIPYTADYTFWVKR